MGDTGNSHGGFWRRRMFARALALALYVAVAAAGVLQSAHLHAGQLDDSAVAGITSTGPVGGADRGIGDANDPCAAADGCQAWMMTPQAPDWQAPDRVAARATAAEAPGDAIAGRRHRPPLLLI
jgi:hypothetical protein